mgnify:CR=1 FL=1
MTVVDELRRVPGVGSATARIIYDNLKITTVDELPDARVHTLNEEHGYVELDGQAGELRIRDTVSSAGSHELEWTFPLAAGAATGPPHRAQFPGLTTVARFATSSAPPAHCRL